MIASNLLRRKLNRLVCCAQYQTIPASGSLRVRAGGYGASMPTRALHSFGCLYSPCPRVSALAKIPLTSERLSFTASVIASQSGQCLAWKPHIQTHFWMCFCPTVSFYWAKFVSFLAFTLRLIDGACSSGLSSRAHGAVCPSRSSSARSNTLKSTQSTSFPPCTYLIIPINGP